MSIIKCPECGKEISDSTKQCIHCGYIFSDENNEEINHEEDTNFEFDVHNFSSKIRLSGLISILLLGLYAYFPLLEVNTLNSMITPVYMYEISCIPYITLGVIAIFALISIISINTFFSICESLGIIAIKIIITIFCAVTLIILYTNTQINYDPDSMEAMMNNIEVSSILTNASYSGISFFVAYLYYK